MVKPAHIAPQPPSTQTRRFVQFKNGATASSYVAAADLNPSDFQCYGCVNSYGEPPVLRVRYPGAELRFCTTSCALEEGFAEAVEAHFEAELAGESDEFIWYDRRYDRLEVFA